MIILLSLKWFTVFFSMELLIGYLKTFPLEMGGGGVRWVGVRLQWGEVEVVASEHVSTMGGGSNFCHFGAYVLIEWPLTSPIKTSLLSNPVYFTIFFEVNLIHISTFPIYLKCSKDKRIGYSYIASKFHEPSRSFSGESDQSSRSFQVNFIFKIPTYKSYKNNRLYKYTI